MRVTGQMVVEVSTTTVVMTSDTAGAEVELVETPSDVAEVTGELAAGVVLAAAVDSTEVVEVELEAATGLDAELDGDVAATLVEVVPVEDEAAAVLEDVGEVAGTLVVEVVETPAEVEVEAATVGEVIDSVTGQIVVERISVTVVNAVERAGQFVTVEAQLRIVETYVV